MGEGAEFYVRRDGDLTLGKAKLDSLSYAFKDGLFVGVVFRTTGRAGEDALLAALTADYGPGRRTGTPMELTVTWAGSTTRIEVFCQSQSVCIGSIASAEAYKAYQAAQARERAPQPLRPAPAPAPSRVAAPPSQRAAAPQPASPRTTPNLR